VNSLLLTATIFEADEIVEGDLPVDGSTVRIKNCTKPQLYRGVEPQVTTNLNDIVVEQTHL
jgi:hypothetical protein